MKKTARLWIGATCVGVTCTLVLWGLAFAPSLKAQANKVPTNLQILQSLQENWNGIACTGRLEVRLGEGSEPLVTAPVAVAFQDNTLKWTAFVTPPTPCAGSVVLGGVKVGLGNKTDLLIGTPPGMIIGNQPATLVWRKLDRKEENPTGPETGVNNLCGTSTGGDSSEIFSAFAGGMSHRPDTRSWDPQHSGWLKLEGETRNVAREPTGRYTVWLDSGRGYLPVQSMRVPLEGAAVVTTFEPREVSPGRWLPVRWKVSGAARATMLGEFVNLQCVKDLPSSWFLQESYPDVASQLPVIDKILTRTP